MMKIRFWRATAVLAGSMISLVACSGISQLPVRPTDNPETQPTIQPTNEPSGPLATETDAPPTEPPTVQPTEPPTLADLPDLGAAPEIENEVWVNADAPVTLAASRGKVVLIEFWTFG